MSLLLALWACKSTPTPPTTDVDPLVITEIPDPLAPCGDATIEVELGSAIDGLGQIEWVLGDAVGVATLGGSGTARSFQLPAAAIAESCDLPTCQTSLSLTIQVGAASLTTEADAVVLTDLDPTLRLDGDPLEDLSPLLYITDEVLEASLELIATSPDRLVVSAASCVDGADCVRAPMVYDGGGDWVVDASELVSCEAGRLLDDWEVQLEVEVEHCEQPLVLLPGGIRFIESDCDGDGLAPRADGEGDCDDLDPSDEGSLGEYIYADADLDGFGDEADPGRIFCPTDPLPTDPVANNNDDCDDTDPEFYLGAPDSDCDGLDQNCGFGPDDEAPPVILYPDTDGDGWGFNDGFISDAGTLCDLPVPGWGPQSDCDETGPNALQINPAMEEDPLTPYDDNCDVAAACGSDCDTPLEVLFATGTGLVAVEDPFALPPDFITLRSWSETPVDVSYADLMGDGKLDAIVVFADSVVIEYDLMDPDGGSEVLSSVGGGQIEVGDFDQDGFQDLLVGSEDLATVYWGGAAPFATTELDLGDITGRGDFDLDGCDDLVVLDSVDLGSYDTVSNIFFGTPAVGGGCERSFVAVPFLTSGPSDLAIGNIDGVSGPELAVAMRSTGTVSNPSFTTQSRVIEFSGRSLVEASVGVSGARSVAISADNRVAFGHEPTGFNLGVSIWEKTTEYSLVDELEGAEVSELLFYPLDGGAGLEDLVVLTDEPGGFDRLYFDGDPTKREFLGFDIPSAGARVIPFEDGFGYKMWLFVSRHPDGSGNNNSRMYRVNQQVSVDEISLTIEGAVAPFAAFPPSHFPPAHPAQDYPL